MGRLLFFFAFLSVTLTTQASTKTAVREIEVEAYGSSYQTAVNEALIEAIARVHGKSISSKKLSESFEVSESNNEKSDFFSSESYQNQIREKTQGTVLGFEILSSEQNSENKWTVSLLVKVADYNKSVSADRHRIAVLPFRSARSSYSLGNQSLSSTTLVDTLASNIVDKFVTTRKFAILDRDFDSATQNELSRIGTHDVAPAELARLSQGLVADYVLVGTIEEVSFNLTERKMRTSDKKFISGIGRMQVSFRLIEVATSQIVFTGSAGSTLTDKQLSRGAVTDSSEISSQFVAKVATSIVRDTTDQIYPLTIVGKQGDELIISEGSSTLKVGQQYVVHRRLDKIIDPYTKELTGWSESLCCEVEVTRVTSRLSYAKITKQHVEIIEPVQPKTLMLKKLQSRQTPTKKMQPVSKPIVPTESKNW